MPGFGSFPTPRLGCHSLPIAIASESLQPAAGSAKRSEGPCSRGTSCRRCPRRRPQRFGSGLSSEGGSASLGYGSSEGTPLFCGLSRKTQRKTTIWGASVGHISLFGVGTPVLKQNQKKDRSHFGGVRPLKKTRRIGLKVHLSKGSLSHQTRVPPIETQVHHLIQTTLYQFASTSMTLSIPQAKRFSTSCSTSNFLNPGNESTNLRLQFRLYSLWLLHTLKP